MHNIVHKVIRSMHLNMRACALSLIISVLLLNGWKSATKFNTESQHENGVSNGDTKMNHCYTISIANVRANGFLLLFLLLSIVVLNFIYAYAQKGWTCHGQSCRWHYKKEHMQWRLNQTNTHTHTQTLPTHSLLFTFDWAFQPEQQQRQRHHPLGHRTNYLPLFAGFSNLLHAQMHCSHHDVDDAAAVAAIALFLPYFFFVHARLHHIGQSTCSPIAQQYEKPSIAFHKFASCLHRSWMMNS